MSCNKWIMLSCVIAISVSLCGASSLLRRAPLPSYKLLDPNYQYPTSYRDHVYTSLSENGQKLFFPVGIHPSCTAKRGLCIQRGKCLEKKMLYISRVCYMRDLVCCYTDFEVYPFVEHSTSYPQVVPNLDKFTKPTNTTHISNTTNSNVTDNR